MAVESRREGEGGDEVGEGEGEHKIGGGDIVDDGDIHEDFETLGEEVERLIGRLGRLRRLWLVIKIAPPSRS